MWELLGVRHFAQASMGSAPYAPRKASPTSLAPHPPDPAPQQVQMKTNGIYLGTLEKMGRRHLGEGCINKAEAGVARGFIRGADCQLRPESQRDWGPRRQEMGTQAQRGQGRKERGMLRSREGAAGPFGGER